ncbi:MAG: tryptophan--tRNA ligase [Candidatus Peribacteria bacterium]|nr:MAG: tryptophan--tRNA ligase [Candidatus Peribacteria bacterium]
MERMHAYKAAIDQGKASDIGVGTFTYPILMAADILLYDATHVPTGQDQKQHVEYTRDIAGKFNNMFGETFILPESIISESVGTIPGIDGRKMSKSYNNYIGMLDEGKDLMKKIKKIPTSLEPIEAPKDPDTCNVYAITRLFLTPDEDRELRAKYTDGGLSFKRAKDYLYEKVTALLTPIQEKYHTISDEQIVDMLAQNKNKANAIAQAKINDVYQKIGFTI